MTQLITSFYLDKSALRQGELLFCLEQNVKAGFDYVFIYVDTAKELDYISTYLNELSKITEISEYRIVVGHEDIRTTYNQYFERTLKNSITVLCNSDIFIPPISVKLLLAYYENEENKDVALCLTRWDYNINQQHELFDRPDSQDTWVVFGLIKGKTSIEFVLGTAGCLSGDTVIKYNRGKRYGSRPLSISDLYKKFNNQKTKAVKFKKELITKVHSIKEETGEVFYNEVKGVIESGIKPTIELIFTDGKTLILTKDHRVLIKGNTYKEAGLLSIGDEIVCIGTMKPISKKSKRKYPYRKVAYLKYHPYAEINTVKGKKYKRVRRYRLVCEASLNNISYDKFLDILNNSIEESKKMKFLDPEMEIHHKDGNTSNDTIENLQVLSKSEHALLHNNGFPKDYTATKVISDIREHGHIMTYDLQMAAPYHNFLANGVFVHNCDNRIAHELEQMGYTIKNPSKTIQTVHVHLSNVRNYLQDDKPKEIIPPPYKLISPEF